jgi:hypothetical protein
MNSNEKLNLKRLIDESQCEDNTDNIRKLKHSVKIRDDIRRIENLKVSQSALRAMQPNEFKELCEKECRFLFNNYTDIFNKILKDEIDLVIMTRMLSVLKMIEDGKVDQHEGSVVFGKILKELYLDSAVKRGENLDNEHESEKIQPVEGKKISWNQFKNMK